MGLLGLILAFTYAGADARLAQRRKLIIDEANAISTAYLRLDLLPENERYPLQDLLKQYLTYRIDAFQKLPDIDAAEQALRQADDLEGQIWDKARSASQKLPLGGAMLLMPPINSMFDIATARVTTAYTHAPWIILVLLVVVSLLSSLIAGYSMSGSLARNYLHMFIYSAIVSLTIYVTVDLEFPRVGFIQEEGTDRALIQLRDKLNSQVRPTPVPPAAADQFQ